MNDENLKSNVHIMIYEYTHCLRIEMYRWGGNVIVILFPNFIRAVYRTKERQKK